MPLDVAKLVQVLREQHGYAIDGFWLPLSRRHSGMENTMLVCYVCTGSTPCPAGDARWQFVDNFVTPATCTIDHTPGALYEEENVVQSTYVQWEVRDINGDGYVDVVFNDVGSVSDLEVLDRPQRSGAAGTQAPGKRNHLVALPVTGIDAVFNLAGPLLSGGENGLSLYPFSAPAQIISDERSVTVTDRASPPRNLTPMNPRWCGVGLWAGALPARNHQPHHAMGIYRQSIAVLRLQRCRRGWAR